MCIEEKIMKGLMVTGMLVYEKNNQKGQRKIWLAWRGKIITDLWQVAWMWGGEEIQESIYGKGEREEEKILMKVLEG